jgi:uncharacterized protein (TIGR03435 family)
MSTVDLTDLLYNVLRTPVVDETGLTGKYDVSINVAKYMGMALTARPSVRLDWS